MEVGSGPIGVDEAWSRVGVIGQWAIGRGRGQSVATGNQGMRKAVEQCGRGLGIWNGHDWAIG